jgi:hypothetical protein
MNANNFGNARLRRRARIQTTTTITIRILRTNGPGARNQLADAEIHFTAGELDGLQLVGLAFWQRRDRRGRTSASPRASSPCRATLGASQCSD